MMIGLSIDFANGGYSIDAPTALWWKQLATAVVFGLGIATVLTLVFTPSMLAFRVWVAEGAYLGGTTVGSLIAGAQSKVAKNRVQRKATKKAQAAELTWEDIADNGPEPLVEAPDPAPVTPLKAAE